MRTSVKDAFSRKDFPKILIALACILLIMLVIPRADHQSYSFEENQPWKYQLLTAEFDMPIMRDSASVRSMRDSIDARFIPFVKRNDKIAEANISRFSKSLPQEIPHSDKSLLTSLLSEVYERGVVDQVMARRLKNRKNPTLREMSSSEENNTARSIDASKMLSEADAFRLIDTLFVAGSTTHSRLSAEEIHSLTSCIVPNIIVDSIADNKYRNQEYLGVNAAIGVIKKGQRIVDRGEIITPQIYTNLNTYQEMLQTYQDSDHNVIYMILAQASYVAILISIMMLFLRLYRPNVYNDTRSVTFVMVFITLFVMFAIWMFELFTNGIYIVPFATVPIMILVFFDSRTAIFSLLITVIMTAIVATFTMHFIFTELVVGILATYSLRQLSRRSQLLRTAAITFITYLICHITLNVMETGELQNVISLRMVSIYLINSVILSFAYVLIWIVEKIFGFTSIVTLVELSDINNPLLRRLAEVAPGTFQHSMQVSTLAAEAARAIGANTQLVRTGALYHDIGKMESPVFFTENQHGVNPHDGLSPETSARKIISHVTNGIEIAQRENLPAVIRNFISQHHGRGIAKYFYLTAKNENPDKEISKEPFTYPGPNPRSKETTILMMADCVEAASRSLKDYSKESIDTLVNKIIDSQVADGLYSESPISFRDIETVKETFKNRLATIYHSRIAYPDAKK